MSKSTMIKDLRQIPTNKEVVLEAVEADMSVQEVLSEIENESINKQNVQYQHNQMMSQPYVQNLTNTDTISNQLLQQQLLQQQILQQQLLSQTKDDSKGAGVMCTMTDRIKQLFRRDNNLFLIVVIVYLVFSYVNVLNLLKIDDFNIFERYPFLINLVTSLIFGLTIVLIKPLM